MAKEKIDAKYAEMISYCKADTFISFDIETTGRGSPMNYPYLKIIEIGAVKIENGKITEKFQTFLNPHIKIPKKITELTGITDEMVKDAPDFSKALRDFKEFIKDYPIIAHNASFDSSFIYYFGDMIGIDFHENPLIDSLKLARKVYPKEKNSLDILAERCGVLQMAHHRADDDAYTLAEIFIQLKEKLQADVDNSPNPDLSLLKKEQLDYSAYRYQIYSANYWEKDKYRRIYVTIKTPNMEYVDFFYDLVNHYWSFKNKEQSKMNINFAALNYYFQDFANNKKTSLKQYVEMM